MNVVIVAPEAVPFAKTGGLADVTGSLFSGLRKSKHNVTIFLPCYRGIKDSYKLEAPLTGVKAFMGDRTYYYDVLSSGNAYFITNDFFFNRDGLYGDSRGDFPDNAERFAFFCIAVLQTIRYLNIVPDVFHLNDWQTGLIPFYQREMKMGPDKTRSVLTIHNTGYQGVFPASVLPKLGIPKSYFSVNGFEFYGKACLLKAGIIYADKVTTVSPSYEKEITTSKLGYGLEGLLRSKGVVGILNGIDYTLWDPGHDSTIKTSYDKYNIEGKSVCKKDICYSSGLKDHSLPLMGVAGRFSSQKGFDVIAKSIEDIVGLGINIVILGKGDLTIERSLRKVTDRYPENTSLNIGFDDTLARRIYAGSDMFLMPSRYEPCGVAQMIAMRYGSVPVVRMTGGLTDTVKDYNPANPAGNGFVFRHADRYSMVDCIKRALCVYGNADEWDTARRNAINTEFTWEKSIDAYLKLYSSLTGNG
jgi:starch synthase